LARGSLKNVCRLIDVVQKEVPVEKAFLNDLERSIEITTDKTARKPSQTYKPSSMNCIRNMYYQRTGADQDNSGSSYVLTNICNVGTDVHERIQKYVVGMKENGMDCEYVDVAKFVRDRGLTDKLDIISQQGMETKLFHKTLQMSFLCDGIIKYKNHYYILELKTEGSYKWTSRQGVDESHYNQGTAYSIAFDIPEVVFVYISRDTLDMKSFLFVPTNEMKQDLIGRIENCEEYVSKLQAPPKPIDVPKKACNYCNYKSLCRKDS